MSHLIVQGVETMSTVTSYPTRIRRPVKARTALSLFSGAGGDTLGLEQAGYRVVAFSEFKAPAIQTHQAAFPDSTLLVHSLPGSSVPSTDLSKIPDEVFEAYRGTDLVFAGFPCQGFSHAGKKREEDPRNELVYEFARVVNIIRPRWIIGENVPGLLSRKGRDPESNDVNQTKPVIDIIRGIFERIGYRLTYRVWKAVEQGVPQERKRLILIGTPVERGWPSLPLTPSVPMERTLRSFLEPHLHGAIRFPNENLPVGLSPHYWIPTAEEKPTGQVHPNLYRLVKGIRGLTKAEREASNEEKEEKKGGTAEVTGGLISFGVRKSPYHGQILDPDLPSKTIICTYGVCPRLFVGLHHATSDTYWIRTLTINELAQIQGFPANYPWKGKEKEIITQIGNAVPPPLARAVVDSLTSMVFNEKEQQEEQQQQEEQEQEQEQSTEEDST